MTKPKTPHKVGTKIEFIGGMNEDRIGGNCSIIEHTNEKGEVTRAMFDLGAMFAPYESGFEAAYPDVSAYFDRINPETGEKTPAQKPVNALFITHAHEDHIGALVNYVRMGYQLPPIKTSRFTKNLIKIVFTQNGVKAPEMERIKAGDNVQVSPDMVVEPFTVSHSILEPIGFHTLTFVDDKPNAGIMNFGDFLTEENMPLGQSFNSQEVKDLLSRKLTTTFLIDSTSINLKGSKRIGFDKAVENTVDVINRNADRSIIISPVISRSFQNVAVDVEAARKVGAKVCLEGAWLNLVYKAMQLSNYNDFDDVIYKGRIDKFVDDKKIAKKYVVCTGAFAQGLNEYKQNEANNGFNAIPMAAATKMALGLHPSFQINSDCLVIERQRIIEEINGKTGPEMLQLMASRGAKVVVTPSGNKPIANFEQVQMQDSGHLNAEAFSQMLDFTKQYAPNAVYIPIHGNIKQCEETSQVAQNNGCKTLQAENMDAVWVQGDETKLVQDNNHDYKWIGVKHVYYNPLEPNNVIPPEGKLEFWVIDKNYQPLDNEPIFDTSMNKTSTPGDKDYYANYERMFDDTLENGTKESNRERKAKLSRKEKKRLDKEEKSARIKNQANNYKQERKAKSELMSYVDGMGVEHIRTTKSGKPRKVNPLKFKNKGGNEY